MTAFIKRTWNERPMLLIMALAIVFRLLAVVFARGYGMIDDHFLAVEAAQSWVDGFLYLNRFGFEGLPSNSNRFALRQEISFLA